MKYRGIKRKSTRVTLFDANIYTLIYIYEYKLVPGCLFFTRINYLYIPTLYKIILHASPLHEKENN